MAKKKTVRRRRAPADDIAYDAEHGKRSFEKLAAARNALQGVSAAPRIDMQSVAVLAIGVARRIAEPATRARFRGIESELPASTVDRLEPAAWALWYAALEREAESATATTAMLPAALVQEATALKGRMLKVVQYHLGERSDVAAHIADIVSGTGYVDLATDLSRLSQLYEDHAEVLADDVSYYDEADREAARLTARRIVEALGELGGEGWGGQVNRAYALLDRTYSSDIRPFALAMFRHENAEQRFPSVFSVRAAPSSSSKKVDLTEGPDSEDADSEDDAPT